MNGKFKFIFGLIELCLMASMPLFNNTKNPKQNLITINENIKKENKDSTKLKVEMIDLGCNGDSTLISFGKTQILVDAGGNEKSGPAIINTLSNELITKGDKKLDYVIFTHADEDHIVNARPLYNFLQQNDISIGCWIDFDMTKDNSIVKFMEENGQSKKLASMYWKNSDRVIRKEVLCRYDEDKGKLLASGKIDYYFTASQCTYKKRAEYNSDYSYYIENYLFNSDNLIKNKITNNIKRDITKNKDLLTDTFTIYSEPDEDDVFGSNGKGDTAQLKILFNPYYSEFYSRGTIANEIDKNACSTCFVIDYNDDQWVFAGDIQEYKSTKSETNSLGEDGDEDQEKVDTSGQNEHGNYQYIGCETKLLMNNLDILKQGAIFYKASHHGSDTSNGITLLDYIKPQFVGISAAATEIYDKSAKEEYKDSAFKFPGQFALDSIGRWTDYIGITCRRVFNSNDKKWENESYFGSLIYEYNPKLVYKMKFTATNMPNIVNPSILESEWFIKNRQFPINTYVLANDSKKSTLNSECTYIKIGHNDIILNAGGYNSNSVSSYINKNKILGLCNDKIVECLVVTNCMHDVYHDLIINSNKQLGLLFDETLLFEDIRYPLYDSSKVYDVNWSIKDIPSIFNNYIDTLSKKSTDKNEIEILKNKAKMNKEALKENSSSKVIVDLKNTLKISLDIFSSDGISNSKFDSKDKGLMVLFSIDGIYSYTGKASSRYSFLYGGNIGDDLLDKKHVPSLNPNGAKDPHVTYQISKHGYRQLEDDDIANLYAKRVFDKAGGSMRINYLLNGKISQNKSDDLSNYCSQAFINLIEQCKCNLYNTYKDTNPLLSEEIKVGYNPINNKKNLIISGIISTKFKYDYIYKTNDKSFIYSMKTCEELFNKFRGKEIKTLGEVNDSGIIKITKKGK